MIRWLPSAIRTLIVTTHGSNAKPLTPACNWGCVRWMTCCVNKTPIH